MCDKDSHIAVIDKESDSVGQGQRYTRGRQGKLQSATRADINTR